MNMLHLLAGPLVGAVIGYFTNYIAVKMLFRPHYPVKIGNFLLPFTPGIIPRRKPQLARAVGRAVGDNLLTGEDIEQMLISEELVGSVEDAVCKFIYQDGSNGPRTIKNLAKPRMGELDYLKGREHLENAICGRILSEVEQIPFGELIEREAQKLFREKMKDSILALMISDDIIRSFAITIGDYVMSYIQDNGHDIVFPMIDRQVEKIENKPFAEYLEEADMDEERLRQTIGATYREMVSAKAPELISKFHVSDVVEEKINQMDVMEVERLVLSVMEHELNSIVSLGAVIGFVIGIVNVFL